MDREQAVLASGWRTEAQRAGSREDAKVSALRGQLRDLCVDAASALDVEIVHSDLELLAAGRAQPVLSKLWSAALGEALRSTEDDTVPAARRLELLELLGRIRSIETDLAQARLGQRDAFLRRIAEALASVRDARTVEDFLNRVPEAGCRLGFDRVLVSRVEDSTWKLHKMCVVRDPRWADELVAVGKASPPPLDGGIVEADVVSRADSCLVFDVQNSDRVVRDLVQVGKSESYGIAPLTVHGEVVGMLHGDCYYQRRDVEAADQALLSLMAEGLSHSLARITILEGLEALHRTAGLTMTSSAAVAAPAAPLQAVLPADNGPLTPREAEIMELLAAGHSNRYIAQQLLITVGTAKSHVTHILRKLDATSRAEAISRWLRGRYPR